MKNLLNIKLFELFDKKSRNYSLFDKCLNPYMNPSLVWSVETPILNVETPLSCLLIMMFHMIKLMLLIECFIENYHIDDISL
jgi:hypothetical protein